MARRVTKETVPPGAEQLGADHASPSDMLEALLLEGLASAESPWTAADIAAIRAAAALPS